MLKPRRVGWFGRLIGRQILYAGILVLVRSSAFCDLFGRPLLEGVVDEEICGKGEISETGRLVAPDRHRRTTQQKLR